MELKNRLESPLKHLTNKFTQNTRIDNFSKCAKGKKRSNFSLLRSMLCSITADPSMEKIERVTGNG